MCKAIILKKYIKTFASKKKNKHKVVKNIDIIGIMSDYLNKNSLLWLMCICHHINGTVIHVVTLTSVKHHAKLNQQFKYYFYRFMVM